MKFGIIGAGMIANFHAKAIQAMADGELHSFYGRRADAVEALVKEHGGKGYTDLDAFLSDPELEIVTPKVRCRDFRSKCKIAVPVLPFGFPNSDSNHPKAFAPKPRFVN